MKNEKEFYQELGKVPPLPENIYDSVIHRNRTTTLFRSVSVAASILLAFIIGLNMNRSPQNTTAEILPVSSEEVALLDGQIELYDIIDEMTYSPLFDEDW